MNYGITDEQVRAAQDILIPNGYDVDFETLRRALRASEDAREETS